MTTAEQEDYKAIASKLVEILQDVMKDCRFRHRTYSYDTPSFVVVTLNVRMGDRVYGVSHMFNKHDGFLSRYTLDGALRHLAVKLASEVLDKGVQTEELMGQANQVMERGDRS